MNESGLYWNTPAVVEVERPDGRREELYFATRLEAEQWIGLLPWLQESGDAEALAVRAAILRPAAVGLN